MDRLRILSDGPTATEKLQCGSQKWWDQEYLIEQLEMKAIPIFNRAFPGRQALFIFDNATIHFAFAKDALRVTKLNIAPGGKQPFMRPGWYWDRKEQAEKPLSPVDYTWDRFQADIKKRFTDVREDVRAWRELRKMTYSDDIHSLPRRLPPLGSVPPAPRPPSAPRPADTLAMFMTENTLLSKKPSAVSRPR
jgi:hypothetical protein